MEETNAVVPTVANQAEQSSGATGEWKTPPALPAADTGSTSINTAPPPSQVPVTSQSTAGFIPTQTTLPSSAPVITKSPVQKPVAKKPGASAVKVIGFIFAFIILLCAITVGLIFADDKGLIKTGISPILKFVPISQAWGGLSANPSTASVQMATALRTQAGMSYSGSFKGYGAEDQLSSTAQACGVATGGFCTVDPLSKDVQFSLKISGANTDLETVLNDAGVNVTTVKRIVSSVLYTSSLFGATRDGSEQTQSWQKSDDPVTVTTDSIKDRLAALLNGASFISNEQVGAFSTYHFRTTASGKDIPFWMTSTDVTGVINWTDSHGSLDVWVSRQSHLPVKITASLTSPDSKTISIDTNYVGSYDQEISAPLSVIESGVTPDATRKKDLRKIASALNQYYSDNGTYPTSVGIEHLDQTTANVVTALVPKYLSAMPADPSSAHYYGYTSNGSTYELSAVLDDATDVDGVKAGAVTLYLVKSTSN